VAQEEISFPAITVDASGSLNAMRVRAREAAKFPLASDA
jgi:hypothetical protein